MLIAVQRLLLKVRQPASRADEVDALRGRARAEQARPIEDEERALAAAVRARKLAAVEAMRDVASCATCAIGEPWPRGHHDGGACCAGTTADLFDDHELAALVHAGTRPGDLVPPPRREAHAGCAFRGARGCTLALADRPARCVHYVCDTLRRELHAGGRLDGVEAALAELNVAMQQYTAVHRARVDREILAPLVAALEAAARR